MQVTTKYGVQSVTRTLPDPVTVGDLVRDPNLKAVLGFGDNVRVLIAGIEQPLDVELHDGATVVIETKTNTKNN